MGRVADGVVLSAAERAFLESQVRRHKVPRSLSDRCRIILLCADGLASKDVAQQIGVHEHTVGKWRRKFVRTRIEGLSDEYRPGYLVKDGCAYGICVISPIRQHHGMGLEMFEQYLRLNNKLQIGSGHTTMIGPTWPSAASHPQ